MFTVKSFVATVLLAGAALAAPFSAERAVDKTALLGKRGGGYFGPEKVYQYDISTGAIDCTVGSNGQVHKYPANGGHDVTTLLTFTYPAIPAGATCQFAFALAGADTLTGSGLIDVFSSLAPAPGCTTGWGPGNQRDQHLGRLQVAYEPATSAWVQQEVGLSRPVPCKPEGTVEAFELVGVYDYDYAKWSEAVSGASIVYSY